MYRALFYHSWFRLRYGYLGHLVDALSASLRQSPPIANGQGRTTINESAADDGATLFYFHATFESDYFSLTVALFFYLFLFILFIILSYLFLSFPYFLPLPLRHSPTLPMLGTLPQDLFRDAPVIVLPRGDTWFVYYEPIYWHSCAQSTSVNLLARTSYAFHHSLRLCVYAHELHANATCKNIYNICLLGRTPNIPVSNVTVSIHELSRYLGP